MPTKNFICEMMDVEDGYGALERLYASVQERSGKMFADECGLIGRALSFSFASYFMLSSGAKRLDPRSQHLAALFYRNCIYLSAAYQMVRRGMPDPAGNNMRTVFETIVWQYGYLCDDGIYSDYLEMNRLEEEKFRSLAAKAPWSNTRERALENLRRKNSFQKAMKALYSKEVSMKFFSNPYWVLCQKAHSSIFGANYNTPNMEGTTTLEKRPEELRDTMRALLYLCAENLTCYLNCFGAFIPQERIDGVLAFNNDINRKIPPAAGLVPDTHRERLQFTLRLREI
jgi:hypothetical protein